MIVYYFCKGTVNFLGRILYRYRTYGKENVPKGGAIIAPNHASHIDPPILGAYWPGKIEFFARDTLFKGFMSWLLPKLRVHPIQRGEADIKTMRKIITFLNEGKKVVVFPEGTRSRDGTLQKPQLGVSMMAQRADVPILPVYMSGTYEVMPAGGKLKLTGRLTTTIGKPIYPKDFAHLPKKEAQQAIADAWENSLRDLMRPR